MPTVTAKTIQTESSCNRGNGANASGQGSSHGSRYASTVCSGSHRAGRAVDHIKRPRGDRTLQRASGISKVYSPRTTPLNPSGSAATKSTHLSWVADLMATLSSFPMAACRGISRTRLLFHHHLVEKARAASVYPTQLSFLQFCCRERRLTRVPTMGSRVVRRLCFKSAYIAKLFCLPALWPLASRLPPFYELIIEAQFLQLLYMNINTFHQLFFCMV